eukprot:3222168-Prymnesium_polylepis.1
MKSIVRDRLSKLAAALCAASECRWESTELTLPCISWSTQRLRTFSAFDCARFTSFGVNGKPARVEACVCAQTAIALTPRVARGMRCQRVQGGAHPLVDQLEHCHHLPIIVFEARSRHTNVVLRRMLFGVVMRASSRRLAARLR